MTRKDYKLIAAALNSTRPARGTDSAEHDRWAQCARAMAAALQADNPNFNPEKFAAACGTEEDYDA